VAEQAKEDPAGAFDASVERIRDLNDRIAETARRGGEASLRAYERLLQTVADVQESGGSRTARFVEAVAKAQASFVREVAAASPDALKAVTERVSEVAGAAARQTRRVPGEETAEGQARGTVAREEDLPIPRYDELSVKQINQRLGRLSRIDLEKVEAYERRHKNRRSVLNKVSALRRA
jgi:hypothetical protein